jgi:Sec-independent protein translocase protein TatA
MPHGLHLPDLLVILAIALLFFGPQKLPEIGASQRVGLPACLF